MGGGIVAIIHINAARAIYLLICDPQDTESESRGENKWAYITQYSPIKIYQKIYGTTITILYKMEGKYCRNYSYLSSFSHFSTILL